MADQSDVEVALVTLIDSLLYPSGQTGTAPPTVIGAPCRIIRGWPNQKQLDADLRAGVFTVSIYPRPNMERNTSRYQASDQPMVVNPTTYTLTGSGQTVTVGGVAPGAYYVQNLGIFVNGLPYIVTATAGQTPAQIATALQILIVAAVPGTTVLSAAITLPVGARIGALRVGATGTAVNEVGRQEKQFQISFWCPNPDMRDLAVKTVDGALRASYFITMADGSRARFQYHGTNSFDAPQKELLYRRDLFYSVEWATTLTTTATQILTVTENLRDAQGNLITSTTR